MFCWPCVPVYQFNETTVMHFSFSLLRNKGLYVFRALLAHPQETLHKRHLVYYVRIVSLDCDTFAPEDEQVMLETCGGPWFSINWMKIASRWFHYTDILKHIRDADKFVVPKSLYSYVRMVLSSNLNRNAVHAKLIMVFNIAYRRLARKS
jgi:hypothetical protein